MSRWYTLHIKNEILFWFLILSLLPLMGLTGANYWYQKDRYESEAKEHLQLILDQKTDAIETHLQRVEQEIELLSLSPDVRGMFERGSLRSEEEKRLVAVVEKYRFHDLFLIGLDGKVLFSVKKEDDFQSDLFIGKYSGTNLGRVYRNALEHLETQISDFEYYPPSQKEALFIATPIFGENRMIGVLAILPENRGCYEKGFFL